MAQVIYNIDNLFSEKSIEIKKDEKPKHTHTLEEAIEEASEQIFVLRTFNSSMSSHEKSK